MKSSPPASEHVDLVDGLIASPEEAAAQRRLRESQLQRSGDLRWDARPPVWLSPPDVARRPTAAGREEFEL